MVQFDHLRLYLGTETFSCLLLLRIARMNMDWILIENVGSDFSRFITINRETKIHVYAKRQTSNSSYEFLRIENKQIKQSTTILMYKTGVKILIF